MHMMSTSNTVIVESGKLVEGGILPLDREDLLRIVELREASRVRGGVVASRVMIEDAVIVEGSVIAEQVIRTGRGEKPAEIREGDLVGFVSVTSEQLVGIKGRVWLIVEGNIFSLGMVRLANVVVIGNVVAPRIELINAFVAGAIASVEAEGETPGVVLDNVVAFMAVSAGNIIIRGSVGLVLPMMYARRGVNLQAPLYLIDFDRYRDIMEAVRNGSTDVDLDSISNFRLAPENIGGQKKLMHMGILAGALGLQERDKMTKLLEAVLRGT